MRSGSGNGIAALAVLLAVSSSTAMQLSQSMARAVLLLAVATSGLQQIDRRRVLGAALLPVAPTLAVAAAPAPFTASIALEGLGDVEVEVRPDWAPLASERFRELVDARFFDDSRLFRVLPGYVAQFGIAGEPAVNKEWLLPKEKRLLDEPRTTTNARGTLSFASGGKNTRTTQIYVNLGDNGGLPNMLDAQGFVPFARVTRGMDLVDKAYSGYGLVESLTGGLGGSVNQGKAIYYGNAYLDEAYPKLTRISAIKRAN